MGADDSAIKLFDNLAAELFRTQALWSHIVS